METPKDTAEATIYVLNGPNLNLLGTREPRIYGHATLADVEKLCADTAAQFGLKAGCRQSNREGELVDFIQEARARKAAGIVINAGASSQTSIALDCAIRAVGIPPSSWTSATFRPATASGIIPSPRWRHLPSLQASASTAIGSPSIASP